LNVRTTVLRLGTVAARTVKLSEVSGMTSPCDVPATTVPAAPHARGLARGQRRTTSRLPAGVICRRWSSAIGLVDERLDGLRGDEVAFLPFLVAAVVLLAFFVVVLVLLGFFVVAFVLLAFGAGWVSRRPGF